MSKLDAYLSDVEKRLGVASYGPWQVVVERHGCAVVGPRIDGGHPVIACEAQESDATFVAHAPQDVAGLVAVVKAVRSLAKGLAALETYDCEQAAMDATFGNHDDGFYAGRAMGRRSVAADIFKALESAVPGSESQHDDEAGLNAR
jgi:hypothetical protein